MDNVIKEKMAFEAAMCRFDVYLQSAADVFHAINRTAKARPDDKRVLNPLLESLGFVVQQLQEERESLAKKFGRYIEVRQQREAEEVKGE